MSEAGTKALGFVAKRKDSRNPMEDEQYANETDPAYLATEPNSPFTFIFPTEAGCRQGGFFDSVPMDFGIPLVAADEDDDEDQSEESRDSIWTTSEFQDIAYELGVADILLAPSDPNANPYHPPVPSPREPTSFGSSVDGGATVGTGDRKSPLRALVRRISNALIVKPGTGVVIEKSDSPNSSPASTLMSLPQIDDVPPQLARFSFASDATTGTLQRYLARRQLQSRAIEKTLNMSILAYEREGSWLIDHDSMDSNFVCPFPTCEAHYGPGAGRKRRHAVRRHVETVYED
ncbi:hypothetical protein FS837_008470 [Tulasnella sp. UAMH 9824]|nr:hypothetical protein FS837_008470 [Tulasnella sp. UAMH 9824]